ncbi:hypothetical protein L914_00626, partial [Phytophthora nicotianae]
ARRALAPVVLLVAVAEHCQVMVESLVVGRWNGADSDCHEHEQHERHTSGVTSNMADI